MVLKGSIECMRNCLCRVRAVALDPLYAYQILAAPAYLAKSVSTLPVSRSDGGEIQLQGGLGSLSSMDGYCSLSLIRTDLGRQLKQLVRASVRHN